MARFGYARISTDDQSLNLQVDALTAAGADRVFTDTVSGAKTARPGLDELLRTLAAGDEVIVWKLDRLGRSLLHLQELLVRFDKDGIAFRSLTESIDTKTAMGKFVFAILGAVAELERENIRSRVKAGQKAAASRGVIIGRKPNLIPSQVVHATRLRDEGMSYSEIGGVFNVEPSSVWRALNRNKSSAAGSKICP
jgi:DNA invertase Pin-like site-specific DNA recombinase